MLISIWDKDDKKSLINRVPASQALELNRMYSARPELFHMDEESLFQILKKEKYSPVSVDNKIRNALWKMLDSTSDERPLDFYQLSEGICTVDLIKHRYFKNAYAMAWVLCPPSSYYDTLAETVDMGLLQLKDVINMPHTKFDENGDIKEVNIGLIEKKARIYSMLEDRLRGKVAQRMDIRAAHAHSVHTPELGTRAAAQALLENPKSTPQLTQTQVRELPQDTVGESEPVDVSPTPQQNKSESLSELQERLRKLKEQESQILQGKVNKL